MPQSAVQEFLARVLQQQAQPQIGPITGSMPVSPGELRPALPIDPAAGSGLANPTLPGGEIIERLRALLTGGQGPAPVLRPATPMDPSTAVQNRVVGGVSLPPVPQPMDMARAAVQAVLNRAKENIKAHSQDVKLPGAVEEPLPEDRHGKDVALPSPPIKPRKPMKPLGGNIAPMLEAMFGQPGTVSPGELGPLSDLDASRNMGAEDLMMQPGAVPSPMTNPDLSAGMGPQTPEGPSGWAQFGEGFLSGLVGSITPAIVAFASSKSGSPEFVTAWATQQANTIKQQDLAAEQQIAQMKLYGDLLSAERAQQQLDISRTNARVTVADHVADLQSNLAPKDPLAFMKSMQGYLPLWESLGGTEEDFAQIATMPNAVLVGELQKNYNDVLGAFPTDQLPTTRIVKNPWAPEDPSTWLTIQEAAELLGHTRPDGSFFRPLGATRPSDVVESTTRDSGGVETTTRGLLGGGALGEPAVKQPGMDVDSIKVEDPVRGTTTIFRTDRKTGRVIGTQTVASSPGGMTGIPSIPLEIEEGQRRATVTEALRLELGRYPTQQEINEALDFIGR